MSIRASRELPALIVWLMSWKASDNGSKSRIRWMTHNCLSSLTNILDLSTLLRPAMLTRLSLGATCFLSAKTSEEQNCGQYNEIIIRSERNTERMKEWWSSRATAHASRKEKEKKEPKPRIPHLALPLKLGSEDHYAMPLRWSGSCPSYSYWI